MCQVATAARFPELCHSDGTVIFVSDNCQEKGVNERCRAAYFRVLRVKRVLEEIAGRDHALELVDADEMVMLGMPLARTRRT